MRWIVRVCGKQDTVGCVSVRCAGHGGLCVCVWEVEHSVLCDSVVCRGCGLC